MSSEPVSQRARQTLKSVKDILEKAEDSTHKAFDKAAPALTKSLDTSMEAASRAFARSVKTIDGATAGDQAKLFRAYRKLLAGQVDFVDSRIRTLEQKERQKAPASSSQ